MKRMFLASLMVLVISASLGTVNHAADPSLVLYLPSNEGEGDIVADASQYGNHGVIKAGKWTDGKFGKGLEFDMETSDVQIADSDSLDLADAFTLAVWIKGREVQEGYTRIIDKTQWPNSGYNICINESSRTLQCEFFNGGTGFSAVATTRLDDDQWHYVVGVFDSKSRTLKVYTDGALEKESKTDGTAPGVNEQDLHIGYNGFQGDHRFNGIIDEVRIYDRALNEDEINEIMASKGALAVDATDKLAIKWGALKSNRQYQADPDGLLRFAI